VGDIKFLQANTWANRPSVSANTGNIFPCTDLDNNGGVVLLISDGSVWKGLSHGSISIAKGGVPIGIPSSGTIGNNGALSGVTAFDRTISECYLYFPANAVYSGSAAGFYYVVMSSTTAGTIYADTYVPGNIPVIPGSPTAISATGPGAYTGVTTETTLAQWILHGGSLGPLGLHRLIAKLGFYNSANNKQINTYLGGSRINLNNNFTTNRSYSFNCTFQNCASESRQRSQPYYAFDGQGGNPYNGIPPSQTAINTANDATYYVKAALTNAADWVLLENYHAEYNPG
jgi:hypothetical protein